MEKVANFKPSAHHMGKTTIFPRKPQFHGQICVSLWCTLYFCRKHEQSQFFADSSLCISNVCRQQPRVQLVASCYKVDRVGVSVSVTSYRET